MNVRTTFAINMFCMFKYTNMVTVRNSKVMCTNFQVCL